MIEDGHQYLLEVYRNNPSNVSTPIRNFLKKIENETLVYPEDAVKADKLFREHIVQQIQELSKQFGKPNQAVEAFLSAKAFEGARSTKLGVLKLIATPEECKNAIDKFRSIAYRIDMRIYADPFKEK